MIAWPEIQTVLLDMDGTLLDLHFDNHFWREHVPARYAERHGLAPDEARAEVLGRYRRAEGSLDWYCVDYWTRELDLDIAALKEEVEHLIAVHPYVLEFLEAVRASGRRRTLVTNAHGKAVALKFRRTRLGEYLDAVVSSHDLGLPKEQAGFWERLAALHPFAPESTLLIDDSLSVLRCARAYGIRHLLAVRRPDSKGPEVEHDEFPRLTSFRDILPPEG